jgi:hypothetical protein|nr:MAG TPA: hypothetical protein [Bacteriophage sp.]
MPRARKQADILTAKRKRVRRAINTIRKSITPRMPESERHARMMYVQRLETNLKQTYVGRVQNKQLRVEAYARAMENADKLVRQAETVKGGGGKRGEQRRSFNIFRQEMRVASKGMPSALGDLGREKVKIFWRYTQNIWQRPDVPPEKRLEVIMEAYGANSLSELFDTIMQRNEKVLEYIKNMKMHADDLEDYTDVDGGSPIWLIAVTPDVVR